MIEDICRFVTVVDNQSVTKAAKKLGITQPAVSLSIRRLETATHTILFSRNGKQCTITPDGQSIYQIGLRILELWERAKNPLTRSSALRFVTIGLFDNAALQLAPFFQKKLGKKALQIEINIDNSTKLLQELQNGILDLCVCVLDQKTLLPNNALRVTDFSEQLIPVSSHKITHTPVSAIPFILYKHGSNTRTCIDQTFLAHGIQPTIVVESTSTSFMKELAMRGSGITLLPRNFVFNEVIGKKLFIQPLSFTFYRKIGIFVRKNGQVTLSDPFVLELTSFYRRSFL